MLLSKYLKTTSIKKGVKMSEMKGGSVLFFVRHGKYEGNIGQVCLIDELGPHLSSVGREETASFAKKIAQLQVPSVYCGLSHRAKETARIISQANVHCPPLNEDPRVGPMIVDYRGADIIALTSSPQAGYDQVERAWFEGRLPSIEPPLDFYNRVAGFLEEMRDASGNLLVVAHWETLRAAIAYSNNITFTNLNTLPAIAGRALHNQLYSFVLS